MSNDFKNEIDTEWFRNILKDRKLSQRRLAKLIDMDPAAVSLMFRGRRKVSTTEAATLATVLGVPLSDVMEHLGARTPANAGRVPIVGTIDAEGEILLRKAHGYLDVPVELPENVVAVRDEDPASMRYGWTLVYDPRGDVPREAIGKLCVVRLMNGAQYVRFLRNGIEHGTYSLLADQGVSMANVRLLSASPVLWIKI